MKKQKSIAKQLLAWHETIDREMPWKQTNDPYKIWLSEVILQQTRVAQGLPYYLKFVEQYPTIAGLAAAPADDVMKLWQGLGYYSRARNMHHAAQTVVADFDGVFPTTYKDVLSLKGVGKYTAAAIMSFAYGASHPVVDGNVLRVISRLHGIMEAVDDKQTIDQIYTLSESYISKVNPAAYNQAIMDLGALVCKPRNPDCTCCPFKDECVALGNDLIDQIPYKAKKIKKRTRYFHYLHIRSRDGYTVLHHRGPKDIWQGLYDMPMIEKIDAEDLLLDEIKEYAKDFLAVENPELSFTSKTYKHILTHQTIFANFHIIDVEEIGELAEPFVRVEQADVQEYAVPILISNYLEESCV